MISAIVSIRPRLGPGETPSGTRPHDGAPRSFNPPPAGLPGGDPKGDQRDQPIRCGFNPPPAGMPRETRSGRAAPERTAGFNPPPAGMPGETQTSGELPFRAGVSIRPPAGMPGRQLEINSPALSRHVSRHAPGCECRGQHSRLASRPSGGSMMFQSAPGWDAGRRPVRTDAMLCTGKFQSRPGWKCRGDTPYQSRLQQRVAFQSAPGCGMPGEPSDFAVLSAPPCGRFNPPPAARVPGETSPALDHEIREHLFQSRPRLAMPGRPEG